MVVSNDDVGLIHSFFFCVPYKSTLNNTLEMCYKAQLLSRNSRVRFAHKCSSPQRRGGPQSFLYCIYRVAYL